jgi:hypothetical protein
MDPFHESPTDGAAPVTNRVSTSKTKRYLVAAGLLAGGVTLGAVFSPIGLAGAQTGGGSTSSSQDTTSTTAGSGSGSGATDNRTGGTAVSPGDTDHNGMGGGHRHPGRGHRLEDAAAILGLSTDELRTEFQSGKSLAQIAESKGISEDSLVSQLVAKLTERVDQAVADGRITQEQATARLASAEQHIRDLVEKVPLADDGGAGPGSHRGGLGSGLGPIKGDVQALADSLGLNLDQLRQDVMSGKTIAEAAAAQGVTAEQLQTAAVDAATKRIDQALADGKLDQAKADELKANLSARIGDLINGSLPLGKGFDGAKRLPGSPGPGAWMGHGHGHGHGGPDGSGPTEGSSSTDQGGTTQQSSYTA